MLAILFAILSLSAFTFALDRFLIAREEEQNELSGFSVDGNSIAVSGDDIQNLPNPPTAPGTPILPSPIDYTHSSISLGDGRSVIAKPAPPSNWSARRPAAVWRGDRPATGAVPPDRRSSAV